MSTTSPRLVPPEHSERRAACRSAAIRHVILGYVSEILELPCEHLECTARGHRAAIRARQIAIYVAHVGASLPLTQAGALFARSRATAAHACRLIEDARDRDRALDRMLDLIVDAVDAMLAAQCR